MRQIHADPVTVPGLIIFGLGVVGFVIALLAARRRKVLGGVETIATRRSISWLWIVVQGVGVGIAGFGPVLATLEPTSPQGIGEALSVAMLIGGAVWLFHASSTTMGNNWSLVARTRDDHSLVRSGPFGYVRHPIYVAIFLFMLAMAVAYGHVTNLLLAVPVFALGTWMRVRHEERLLRDAFGADYDDYAASVSRFVPGIF